jgi:low temperature requirement protein LtrA
MNRLVRVPWHRPMTGRDPDEPHRSATPLELFFDLSFVVAVAAAASTLHHSLTEDHLAAFSGYAVAFFGIWWAWVNYTWFTSAYDTDDVIFRLLTFVMMTGVLVVAAGVPRAETDHDFRLLVAGYVVMRLALVPLWLRVAREHLGARRTALRYAAGVIVLQTLWVLRTLLLEHDLVGWIGFAILVVGELATPYWAERANGGTPWHRHHVAERYELFTIIVLGEVILATSQAINGGLDVRGIEPQSAMLILGALLLVFSMWWLYFKIPLINSLTRATAFPFGYAHYLVFASIALVGSCLAVLVDEVAGDAEISSRLALLLLAGAVSTYLLVLSVLHGLRERRPVGAGTAVATVAVLLAIAALDLPAGLSVLLLGGALASSLTEFLWRGSRASGSALEQGVERDRHKQQ